MNKKKKLIHDALIEGCNILYEVAMVSGKHPYDSDAIDKAEQAVVSKARLYKDPERRQALLRGFSVALLQARDPFFVEEEEAETEPYSMERWRKVKSNVQEMAHSSLLDI